MKPDTTNTVLNFALAVLILFGVWFAILTMWRVRDYRALSQQASFASNALTKIQALANDTAAYNQTKQDPVLTHLLQSISRPAAPGK